MALNIEEKLVWAGLLTNNAKPLTVVQWEDILQENVGDYDTYQSDVSGIADYSEFKTYLTNNGFTSAEADKFIDSIKQNFASWSDYQDFVVNQTDSWAEHSTGFSSTTSFALEDSGGNEIAGIRVLEGGGVTYDGIVTSVNTTEVFGERIEFSSRSAPGVGAISVSNFRTDDADNVVGIGETITVTVDVDETSGNGGASKTVSLTEDGEITQEESVSLAANGSTTVDFQLTKQDYTCVEVAVEGLGNETLCWGPT